MHCLQDHQGKHRDFAAFVELEDSYMTGKGGFIFMALGASHVLDHTSHPSKCSSSQSRVQCLGLTVGVSEGATVR